MSATADHTVELVALDGVRRALIERALRYYAAGTFETSDGSDDPVRASDALPSEGLGDFIARGGRYKNALDEFVQLTARKRLIDAERKKVTDRLRALEADLLEDFAQRGISGERHADSGKLVSISRRVWARVARAGEEATPAEKERANDALRAAGLGDFVHETFNVLTLSAHFTEQVRAHAEQQALLPEHERTPLLDIAELLPEQLRGAIELTDQPTLSVRS